MPQIKKTKDGRFLVANERDGKRLAGPFEKRSEAAAALDEILNPPAPAPAPEEPALPAAPSPPPESAPADEASPPADAGKKPGRKPGK